MPTSSSKELDVGTFLYNNRFLKNFTFSCALLLKLAKYFSKSEAHISTNQFNQSNNFNQLANLRVVFFLLICTKLKTCGFEVQSNTAPL